VKEKGEKEEGETVMDGKWRKEDGERRSLGFFF